MFQYAIQPGDTIYSIAAQFNVPIDAILSANPGFYPYNLIVGQIILIPTAGYYTFPRYPVYPRYPVFPILPIPFRRLPGRRFMPERPQRPERPERSGSPGMPRTPGSPGTRRP